MTFDNNFNNMETVMLRDEISKCEDLDDLKDNIFPILSSQREQWIRKVHEIITTNGYSKTKFAELCGVSRVTIDKWCKGAIPKNRETFLKIGMVANYDVTQMNQLLQRYGQYPALYSKCLEDCICLYVLQHRSSNPPLQEYQYILERIKANFQVVKGSDDPDLSTAMVDRKISELQTSDELELFINENVRIFSSTYQRFYAYVKTCIRENYQGYADSVFELAEGQGWSSSLRRCVSAIRQNKWYPTRNKIISLGLHLSMDHDQIDDMLQLAHMEPLCAKNVFESVIIFILEDASLNNIMDSESDDYDPDELCRYAKSVLSELELPEVDAFLAEISDIEDEW